MPRHPVRIFSRNRAGSYEEVGALGTRRDRLGRRRWLRMVRWMPGDFVLDVICENENPRN